MGSAIASTSSAVARAQEAEGEAGLGGAEALSRLEQFQKTARLPAVASTALCGDEVVWSGAVGLADLATRVSATAVTRFRLGSVTKTLTSGLLGTLLEERKIDLDRTAGSYLPRLPHRLATVTVRQLAAHLAGLSHYEGEDFLNRTHYPGLQAALDKFRDRPLVAPPGLRFSYSSFGYNLLGALMEAAAERPFLTMMEERLTQPLGLVDTLPETQTGQSEHRATPYTLRNGKPSAAPGIDQSDGWPAAGFLSSAADLARYGQAFLTPSFLRPETIETLWQEQKTALGKRTGYGLGWQHATVGGARAVGHSGSHLGATAQLWILPELRGVMSLLANANSPALPALSIELGRLLQSLA